MSFIPLVTRHPPNSWFGHPHKGENLRLRPEAWTRAGATSDVVDITQGVLFSFRTRPEPVYDVPNHLSFDEVADTLDPYIEDYITRGLVEM